MRSMPNAIRPSRPRFDIRAAFFCKLLVFEIVDVVAV